MVGETVCKKVHWKDEKMVEMSIYSEINETETLLVDEMATTLVGETVCKTVRWKVEKMVETSV